MGHRLLAADRGHAGGGLQGNRKPPRSLTTLITQLEQAEGVDLEKGARAIWDAVPHHCEVTWDEAKKLEFMQQEYKATMRQARACYEANNIKVKE